MQTSDDVPKAGVALRVVWPRDGQGAAAYAVVNKQRVIVDPSTYTVVQVLN